MAASQDANISGIIFYCNLIGPISIIDSLHYAPTKIFIPLVSWLKSNGVKVNEYSFLESISFLNEFNLS